MLSIEEQESIHSAHYQRQLDLDYQKAKNFKLREIDDSGDLARNSYIMSRRASELEKQDKFIKF